MTKEVFFPLHQLMSYYIFSSRTTSYRIDFVSYPLPNRIKQIQTVSNRIITCSTYSYPLCAISNRFKQYHIIQYSVSWPIISYCLKSRSSIPCGDIISYRGNILFTIRYHIIQHRSLSYHTAPCHMR